MKKFLCYLILPLLGLTLLIGCKDKDKDDPKPNEPIITSIYGSWELFGFGDLSDQSLIEARPKGKEKSAKLTFNEDQTLEGVSACSEIGKSPFVLKKDKISFPEGIDCRVSFINVENDDSELFNEKIRIMSQKKEARFSITNDQLKLFYSETEYLLFNRKK